MKSVSMVNMNRRCSKSYVGSVYTNDPEQMEVLAELRRAFKIGNKNLPREDKKRLMVLGREPKVGGYTKNWCSTNGWCHIGNAKRIDIYVQNLYGSVA